MNSTERMKKLLPIMLVLALSGLPACEHEGLAKRESKIEDHVEHDHAAHDGKGVHEEIQDKGHDCQGAHDGENEHARLNEQNHSENSREGHEGHGHGIDLNRPLSELFEDTCEHDMKTYACDECRYEVGVVKVPGDLVDSGLIRTERVGRINFDSGVLLTGEVRFDERKVARLSPRVSGVIDRVRVDLGDAVSAGEVLVELESVDLAEAQADYLEALAERRLSKKALSRHKSLRDQNITSEREFLEARQLFESSDIRVNSARQKLLRLGVSKAETSKLDKNGLTSATGRMLVRAPFSGEVLELQAARGERVETGDKLLLVGDTASLWVWVDLYENQLASVKSAMAEGDLPVSLNVRAYPDRWFSGKMNLVGKVMDERTRTVKARVLFDNSEGMLKPGMFARVRLEIDATSGKLAVPESAVLSDDDRSFIFILHESEYFVRRPVSTGRKANGYVEVLDGLSPDQTIAVAGAFLLKSDVLRSKMGEGCAH